MAVNPKFKVLTLRVHQNVAHKLRQKEKEILFTDQACEGLQYLGVPGSPSSVQNWLEVKSLKIAVPGMHCFKRILLVRAVSHFYCLFFVFLAFITESAPCLLSHLPSNPRYDYELLILIHI